ncbi:MAG: histidine kinase [Roseateles depolymerans]|uniref:histidine kinase n=1 Tax=Roseateles depolymerans TaxID=76731 RepID=A0A2W5DVX2_9BURK|nr:MAG: histidine kinase [Roseateles depolymerans]
MLLLSQLSGHRLSSIADDSAQRWAEAIARTAASTAADRLTSGDTAGLERSLRELATLPGVERIEVLDGRGRATLSLSVDSNRRVIVDAPAPDTSGLPVTWAPVGPGGRDGSIGISFTARSELLNLEALRFDGVLAIGATGLLSIVAASLLLGWTLKPLQRVARFSHTLASTPGAQLQQRNGSWEVNELAQALNEASRMLSEQHDAIRSGDRRTQGIADAVPDAIIGVDAQGLIRSASPVVSSVFGREPQELLGRPLTELLPDITGEEAERRTQAGLYMRASATLVARFEHQALRLGGTCFPAEVSLARLEPRGEDDAESLRYVCAVRDVTDQRMLDAMLNLYVRALECSSNGVVISDLSLPGRPIIYANAAFERITGYDKSSAIGRSCDFLLGDDTDQPESKALQLAISEGRSASIVLRHYRMDGSLFFDEVAVAPVFDEQGQPRHYVCILNDVTERERARLAIAERNARLNAIFDLSPDGFVVFDREGQLVYANPAFLAMTGWCGAELSEGLNLAEFDQRLAGLCEPERPYAPTLPHTGDNPEELELLYLAPPRARTLTRLTRHNAGGQGESILYFRDVTHETEVDRMKSEFLTTAAHELRTPMVSVFGFTELLLQRPVPEGRRRDVLETIHRQASLLIAMINDLLDLARIESRQGRDLRRERVTLGDLVADTVERMAGALAGHEMRIMLPVEHGALALWVDPTKTSQALTNVLSNAIKYSQPGSVVRISSLSDGERVGLAVTDQGIGMTQAQLSRVFERFYRADPSGNIPGTGLGMSLVKEIVELQDGQVEIRSEANIGTVVTLWLPLAPATLPAPPTTA